MCQETRKAFDRRAALGWFDKYLVGSGIDIGCGPDVLTSPQQLPHRGPDTPDTSKIDFSKPFICRGWDWESGDAQYMKGVDDNIYDFVYSSHCLEHMVDPSVALQNWWRILKPGGHLVIVVPDEDLYEQGVWPSRGNGDHKTTWTVYKAPGVSWSPVSRNLKDEIVKLLGGYEQVVDKYIKHLKQIDANYNYDLAKTGWHDQTGPVEGGTEAAVECVVQKPL